jgi:DNA polymerase-3 subunit delta'
VKARGERGSGRKQLEERHKREARRYRADEVRAGLTELSRRYRDEMATAARPNPSIAAIEAIAELAREMVRNPNERLQLVALFLTLGRLPSR